MGILRAYTGAIGLRLSVHTFIFVLGVTGKHLHSDLLFLVQRVVSQTLVSTDGGTQEQLSCETWT